MPIGAADPAVFRESTAILQPEVLAPPLHRRVPGAARHATRGAARPAGGGRARRRHRPERLCEDGVLGDADPGDDVALLAVRPMPAVDTHISLTLPAEPGSLAQLRRRLLPARDRRDGGRAVRDHAHHLRGGRQRDRARLRPGRRDLRGRGGVRRRRAHRQRARHGQLAREAPSTAGAPHHRGPHGRGEGRREGGGTLIRMRRRIREDRAA